MAAIGVDQGAKLDKLRFQLEAFIENLRTVGVIAGDFQQNGQTNFNEKLNGLVENMRYLNHLKDDYSDIHIPLAALEYIDEGHNPELFTRHQLEQSLADYKTVQRKVQAYQNFRSKLVQQLEPVFPTEIKAYVTHSRLQQQQKQQQQKQLQK